MRLRTLTAFPRLTAPIAGIAAVCAALAWHPAAAASVPAWILASTFVAIVGSAMAFPDLTWRQTTNVSLRLSHTTLRRATLLFVAPALIAASLWSRELFRIHHAFVLTSSSVGAGIWLLGIAAGLLLLSRMHLEAPRLPSEGEPGASHSSKLGWLILTCLIVFSAMLRFWHLGSLPEGIWSDEVDSAADAVRMLHSPFQPFAPGNFGHNPSLYFYAMAALISLAGNSIEVLRATSALFGVAAVVVVFLLGRQIRGTYFGLMAATLMASASWAVTFSRVGMPNIPIPAVTGLGYLFFIIAMQRPSALWLALSGCLFGFSLDTYPGAYLPALVPVLLLFGRAAHNVEFARSIAGIRLILPLCLAVAAAPTLTALMLDSSYVLGRINVTSLLNEYHGSTQRLDALAHNLRAYALMFTVEGDHNGRHNLVAAPMVDRVTGPLFLLGLGMCFRRWRNWLTLTLLLWLGSNLLSGVLSVDYEAPHGARTLGVLAPVLLIAALPLYAFPDLLASMWIVVRPWLGWTRRQIVFRSSLPGPRTLLPSIVCVLLLLVTATGLNMRRYFVEQSHDLRSWSAMTGDLAVAGRAINRLDNSGYSVRTDAVLARDIVVRYTAPAWTPQAYDPLAPTAGLKAGRKEALVIPVGQIALVLQLTTRDRSWHTSTIGPGNDSRTVSDYVLTRG